MCQRFAKWNRTIGQTGTRLLGFGPLPSDAGGKAKLRARFEFCSIDFGILLLIIIL